jgi:hypothetical protein
MSTVEADIIDGVANQLSGAIERSDTASAQRLWSDDIAVWKLGELGDRDKVRALRVVDWTTDRRYEILERGSSTAVSSSSGRIDEYFNPTDIARLLD